MKEEKINQKVEEALSSLEGLKKAEVNDDDAVFNTILKRLDEPMAQVRQLVPMKTVWLAAASLALMFVLNVGSLFFAKGRGDRSAHTEGGHSAAAVVIAQAYFNPNNP